MTDFTAFYRTLIEIANGAFDVMYHEIREHNCYNDASKERIYNARIWNMVDDSIENTVDAMGTDLREYIMQRLGGHYNVLCDYAVRNEDDVLDLIKQGAKEMTKQLLIFKIKVCMADYDEDIVQYYNYKEWVRLNIRSSDDDYYDEEEEEEEEESKDEVEQKRREEERRQEEEERLREEAREKRQRWLDAPREHSWVVWSAYQPKSRLPELPFDTTTVPLEELRRDAIIAETRGGETEDTMYLYKVLRVNKKSISVEECDQRGLGLGADRRSKLPVRTYPYMVLV
jgi:hypothetical protein